ncbi:methyltransferase domain-containing protein [Azospirillum sp. ST 5-10]|uniref:methyltransferase domain-containing protein n=1 Tax=unclassified Azospirillum TaxID=2630922 RepID=UPI003F4A70FF
MNAPLFREATCPACGHHVAIPFLDGGLQPLATIAWPRSAADARNLPRYPLDFVRCVACGHVSNVAFDYGKVPYTDKPNLMFNRAAKWSAFLDETSSRVLSFLGDAPTVVEIGYGDGSFLAALAEQRPGGRYIGFDPHGASGGDGPLEFRRMLFDPAVHLAELRPDMLISRHVLEHLVNPLGFLQGIAFASASLDLSPLAYFEVPCIDNALRHGRTVDFYYEHSSQFTTTSFHRMLSRSSCEIIDLGHGYGDEVVYGLIRLDGGAAFLKFAPGAKTFNEVTREAMKTIPATLDALHRSGQRVAVWGGTGKSAAFMCRYGVDAERFPLVVDSDPAKVGTFVPGTGQEIRSRDALREPPVDVVIIPPQWRAADIVLEMDRAGIAAAAILIEHQGRLIDFHKDRHPYR